jgi:hypothetical protein
VCVFSREWEGELRFVVWLRPACARRCFLDGSVAFPLACVISAACGFSSLPECVWIRRLVSGGEEVGSSLACNDDVAGGGGEC